MAPSAAAITIWFANFWRRSPMAKTPGTLDAYSSSAMTKPCSFTRTAGRINVVFGARSRSEVHAVVDPLHEIELFLWRAVHAGKLFAVVIENEGRRGLYPEAPGQL